MIRALRYGLVVAAAVVILCGCADDPEILTSGSVSSSGTELSSAEFSAQYGACTHDPDDIAPTVGFVSSVEYWAQLSTMDGLERDPATGGLLVPGMVGGDAETLHLSASYADGARRALEEGGEAWAAVSRSIMAGEPVVLYVVASIGDAVYFPGDCQDQLIFQPLHDLLGDSFEAAVRAFVGADGTTIAETLAAYAPEHDDSGAPAPVILNPETADAELLASMGFVILHIRVPDLEVEAPLTICTEVAEGWNECAPWSAELRRGIALDAYVGHDGLLEFWLLDNGANVLAPLAYLGEASIPPAMLAAGVVGLDVELDGRAVLDAFGAGEDPPSETLTVLEILPEAELQTADWPGLAESLAAVREVAPDR